MARLGIKVQRLTRNLITHVGKTNYQTVVVTFAGIGYQTNSIGIVP